MIAIELVVAIVCLFAPGLQGVGTAILTHMLKGFLIRLAVGAIVGGISGYAQEGVGGILKGALSGARDGALMGAAFGGLGGFGAGLCTIGQCSTAINTLFNVSSVISVGMQGFDMLALGDMTMMRLSKDLGFNYNGGQIAAANAKAHSNLFYNAVQIGTGMTAAFTGGYKSTAKCFIAGTLVLTANGVVTIEMIKAGDLVYAANADTLEVSLKPVLETYIRETSDLVHVTVNGVEIVSTFDHPYYVKGKGFVNAANLCIGYELINNSGNILSVEQIFRERLDKESEKVYNIKVDDYHTYFVSKLNILVHNAEYSPEMKQKIQERQKAGHEYEKEQHEQLKKINSTAEDQVRVKPIDENGNVMSKGGNYLDDLYVDKNGKFGVNEYKLGPDSPYQKNQIANGFPEGATNIDRMIVSGEHKGEILPKGTPVTTYRKE